LKKYVPFFHEINMRLFLVGLALCASLIGVSSQVSAAAFGSSILNSSNLRLQYLSGGSWVNATTTQATVFNTTILSQSSATLGGSSTSSGIVLGLDAPQSFVSSDFGLPANQGSAPLVSYTNPGMGLNTSGSFAIGDTNGSGTTVIGGSLSSSTLAELNTLGALTGTANGNVGGTSIFQVVVNQSGQYRLAYDAGLNMQTSGEGTAESEFRVQINQGLVSIDSADPLLNTSISGNTTLSFGPQNFFTSTAALTGGGIATFTITQNSTVGAAVIPEPSSMAIFGLMSVGSFLAWRRRRV
jgi:hypothetical protein